MFTHNIPEYIRKSRLPVNRKMQVERAYLSVVKKINKKLGRSKEYDEFFFSPSYLPLVYSNRYYGNEYVLYCYAKPNGDLYAIIEHGLYFGNNIAKVPFEYEWDLGCILTYGDYRQELIRYEFPEYYCETIGPPILYANDEKRYQQKIINDLQISGRVLLFFPIHGLEDLTPKFDVNELSDQLLLLANDNNCNNIIICSFLSGDELYQTLRRKSDEIKVFMYSCGSRFDQEFLFYQRALITLSSVTASNGLGTHVGNCVGLHKPHVILKQEITYEGDLELEFGAQTRSSNWKDQFEKEQTMFENAFSYRSGKTILTKEQYQLCDYYWGFSKKKNPAEIRDIYQKCREHALKFIRRKN